MTGNLCDSPKETQTPSMIITCLINSTCGKSYPWISIAMYIFILVSSHSWFFWNVYTVCKCILSLFTKNIVTCTKSIRLLVMSCVSWESFSEFEIQEPWVIISDLVKCYCTAFVLFHTSFITGLFQWQTNCHNLCFHNYWIHIFNC